MVKREHGEIRIFNVKEEPEDVIIILDNDDTYEMVGLVRDTSPEVEIVSESLKPKLDDEVIILDSPPRPRKKSRLVMEVVLPTMAQLTAQRKMGVIKVEDKKFKGMKKGKVKKLDMQLNVDVQTDRLKRVNGLDPYPIDLDKALQEFTVSRDFMSSVYGGSMQATCPKIAKRRFQSHGMKDFTCLHENYHPNAPPLAGYPGLFLSTCGGDDWEGLQRVFTRLGPNKWQYMGQYEILSAEDLTKLEWASQNEIVRRTWGNEICRQGWGGFVRSRVRARQELGREPTHDEIEEVYEAKRYTSTTPEEIIAAYDCGEEMIGVWTMKCVDYDTSFQLQLIDKFPSRVPVQRKPRKKTEENTGEHEGKKPAKKEKGKASASTSNNRKRKRHDLSESDLTELESDDELVELRMEVGDAEDQEALRELTYTSKGTRSRPIRL